MTKFFRTSPALPRCRAFSGGTASVMTTRLRPCRGSATGVACVSCPYPSWADMKRPAIPENLRCTRSFSEPRRGRGRPENVCTGSDVTMQHVLHAALCTTQKKEQALYTFLRYCKPCRLRIVVSPSVRRKTQFSYLHITSPYYLPIPAVHHHPVRENIHFCDPS